MKISSDDEDEGLVEKSESLHRSAQSQSDDSIFDDIDENALLADVQTVGK